VPTPFVAVVTSFETVFRLKVHRKALI